MITMQKEKRKVLIVFDDMIADIMTNNCLLDVGS